MLKILRSVVWLALLALALNVLSTSRAFAQAAKSVDKFQLPRQFLKKALPLKSHLQAPGKNGGITKNAVTANASVPGIDSLANWTGQFTAPGFDFFDNPQSVWPFEMVGAPPESGRKTTIGAPIVPVTVRLLDKNGHVAKSVNGDRLILRATPSITQAVVNSPIFQPFVYTSGVGQFNDQMARAEFWDRIQHGEDGSNWHTVLNPSVKRGRTMDIPYGFWYYGLNDDGSCCAFFLVDEDTFGGLLFPPTFPVDNTTVIGAAELAGDVTTRDLSTFLFNNIYLYGGTPDNCCVLGFHTYDFEPGVPSNGNRERRYVLNYSSWISPNLFLFGFEDTAAYSHEMAETFNDPFVDNETPWWLSVDPFTGGGICDAVLETGDVVEVLTTLPVYAIPMNGRTYHVQNEAMFPWFAFESPSPAHLGAYSFPDETTLTSLSPGPLHAGCP